MYKKILLSLYLLVLAMLPMVHIFGDDSRGTYWDMPMEVLDNVVDRADTNGNTKVIVEPNLNNQAFWVNMKVSNTLDSLREMIWPYLQRMLYIWLAWWTLLIIRNWFLLTTTSFGDEWKKKDIISKIKNILIGILLITWFYFIIKLVLWLINFITSAQW